MGYITTGGNLYDASQFKPHTKEEIFLKYSVDSWVFDQFIKKWDKADSRDKFKIHKRQRRHV